MPTVTTATLPGGTSGTNYTAPALSASGGTAPYTFAATGLPAGLSLNASTGIISGTPTKAGTFAVDITATDSTPAGIGGPLVSTTKTLTIVVNTQTKTVSTGHVTLRVASTGGDGTFRLTTTGTSGLSGNVATSGGSGQLSASGVPAGTYGATISLPDGFALTAVTCDDTNSSGSISGNSATIRLAVGETVTCTFSAVNARGKAVAAIHRFMNYRNDQLLNNGPDRKRQIDRLMQAGSSGQSTSVGYGYSSPTEQNVDVPFSKQFGVSQLGMSMPGSGSRRSGQLLLGSEQSGEGSSPVRLSGSNDGPMQFSFGTSLSDVLQHAERNDANKLASMSALGFSPGSLPRSSSSPAFDVWVQGRYADFSDERDQADLDGHIGLLSVGADYLVSDSLLIGAWGQFDDMKQRSASLQTEITGSGWLAGPYATVRLSQHLFLQGRAAWGRSNNDVSPFLTYTDEFETTRWLAATTLAGQWQFGPLQFSPSASMGYIEDKSEAYVDSLGVSIPSVKANLGQLTAGPEISYKIDIPNGVMLRPQIGIEAIWNFATNDIIEVADGSPAGPPGLRGKVNIGLQAVTPGGISIEISGNYDGLGVEDFDAVSGTAMFRVPLN